MQATLRYAFALAAVAIASQAAAQVVFYENEGFQGRSFSTQTQVDDFGRNGFNDRASSVVVLRDRWEVCDDARFGGRCTVLRPGRYPSLAAMGMNDRVSSVRAIARGRPYDDDRYAPVAAPVYDNHRRRNERLYEADVTSVRAVVGTSQQRCWIEREQVGQDHRGDANIPGALAGALLGGVLGHQIGGGSGKDIATAGGVVGGALLGANVGRDRNSQHNETQNVQRCSTASDAGRPEYWDVTYRFRGQDHRVQMTTPPGPTITVNRAGEPRAS